MSQAEVMAESPEPKRPSSPAVEIKAEVTPQPVVPKVVSKAEAPVEPVKPKVESLNLSFFLGGKMIQFDSKYSDEMGWKHPRIVTRWWFFSQIFLCFTHIWGKMNPFWRILFRWVVQSPASEFLRHFVRKLSMLPDDAWWTWLMISYDIWFILSCIILDDDEIWNLKEELM